jgi:Uma2 family endonuclease
MKEILSLDQLDVENGQYSYDDYLTWKFEQTVELIKGKILAMAAPNRFHQGISWQLSGIFYNHFKNHSCRAYTAPFDVRLCDKQKSAKANKEILTVVQPDICVICDLKKLDEKGCLGAPDLVVEILSKGNSTKEMKVKKQLYEENEIREYWIFDPERECAFQFHLTDAGVYSPATIYVKEDILNCAIFPALSIPLEEVFRSDDQTL